jgi:hypothetical protein
MSFWTPEVRRRWLIEEGIAFAHSQIYESSPSMGGIAESHIRWIAMAHLVGLGPQMIDLAPPAITAIDTAIARGEHVGPDRLAWHGLLQEAKALAQWLLTGQNPAPTWALAFEERVAAQKRYAGESLRAGDRNRLLDDTLAVGFQAGCFAQSLAYHDALAGGPPKGKVSSIKAPRQLAYALCQRALGHSPGSDAELIRAGHRVLREHLAERWLHNGQYERAAVWLKIVYGLEAPQLTPAEVLLKAYDDMPTIPRPAFLPAG